jgi:hypothetical protein
MEIANLSHVIVCHFWQRGRFIASWLIQESMPLVAISHLDYRFEVVSKDDFSL